MTDDLAGTPGVDTSATGPATPGPGPTQTTTGGDLAFFDDEVTIRLPAQSIYLAVLRTAVASVAARGDFTIDDIEDLRIAVDEACGLLLDRAAPGAMLQCHFAGRPDSVVAAVSTTVTDTAPPDTSSFGWLLLTALAGAVQADVDGDKMTIMLSRKRT